MPKCEVCGAEAEVEIFRGDDGLDHTGVGRPSQLCRACDRIHGGLVPPGRLPTIVGQPECAACGGACCDEERLEFPVAADNEADAMRELVRKGVPVSYPLVLRVNEHGRMVARVRCYRRGQGNCDESTRPAACLAFPLSYLAADHTDAERDEIAKFCALFRRLREERHSCPCGTCKWTEPMAGYAGLWWGEKADEALVPDEGHGGSWTLGVAPRLHPGTVVATAGTCRNCGARLSTVDGRPVVEPEEGD